jgi:hypothetical protein
MNSKYLKYKNKYLQYKYQLGGNEEIFKLLTTRLNPDSEIDFYVKHNSQMVVNYINLDGTSSLNENRQLESWCKSLVDLDSKTIKEVIIQQNCDNLFKLFMDHFQRLADKDTQPQLAYETYYLFKIIRRWTEFFRLIPRNEQGVVISDMMKLKEIFCEKFKKAIRFALDNYQEKTQPIHMEFLRAFRG